MDIKNFTNAFKKTFAYTILSQTLTDEQLFDYFVMENGDIVFSKEQMRQIWSMWQAAKASAVPDIYTPVVLALEDVQSKIAQASFLTMDADNENEVFAVDANELDKYIADLIEAQEQA